MVNFPHYDPTTEGGDTMQMLCRAVVMWVLALHFAASANAQEHFGNFLDNLKGSFITDRKPRPVFKLGTEFRFKDPNGLLWITPNAAEVDGASIPPAFWSIVGGPFDGPYINASVIHDHYCKTKERTAHDTHRNFYYGMRASQVPEWQATLMYWAVSTFGPSWKLEKRVVMRTTCVGTVCTAAATAEDVMVATPAVDLSDPVVLAAAISKTNAVARTLLTTDGKVLDVTVSGQVSASMEGVQRSASTYREVFASKDFTSSSARLGLLSQQAVSTTGVVQPWAGNRIPRYSDVLVLTPQTAPRIIENSPFKLDFRSKALIRDRVDIKSLETAVILQNRG